jgi:hypothetical protein
MITKIEDGRRFNQKTRVDRPYLPIQSDDLGTKTYIFRIKVPFKEFNGVFKILNSV